MHMYHRLPFWVAYLYSKQAILLKLKDKCGFIYEPCKVIGLFCEVMTKPQMRMLCMKICTKFKSDNLVDSRNFNHSTKIFYLFMEIYL